MTPRNPTLDDVRGLAALLVVFAHGAPFLTPLVDLPVGYPLIGALAVELFFALSGFLVGGLILDAARHDASWFAVFMTRRWLRTLPAYAAFLLLAIVVACWLGETLPSLWPYVTMTQNLGWAPATFFPVSWSLAIEEIFYLLAAVTALAISRRRPSARIGVLAGLLVTAIALRVAYAIGSHDIAVPALQGIALLRLDAIFYGVIAVALHRHWPAARIAARNGLAIAGLALLAATTLLHATGLATESPIGVALIWAAIPASFAMMLPAIARQGERHPPDPLLSPVRAVARISYPLYLGHLSCAHVLVGLGVAPRTGGDAVSAFGIYLLASLALAQVAHASIERPIYARRDAWGRRLVASLDRLRARFAVTRSARASVAAASTRAAK